MIATLGLAHFLVQSLMRRAAAEAADLLVLLDREATALWRWVDSHPMIAAPVVLIALLLLLVHSVFSVRR